MGRGIQVDKGVRPTRDLVRAQTRYAVNPTLYGGEGGGGGFLVLHETRYAVHPTLYACPY